MLSTENIKKKKEEVLLLPSEVSDCFPVVKERFHQLQYVILLLPLPAVIELQHQCNVK